MILNSILNLTGASEMNIKLDNKTGVLVFVLYFLL